MTKHLCFDYIGAYHAGEKKHSQVVMKEYGITYQDITFQSLNDSVWFWNCENIPEILPDYITDLNIDDPIKFVGWGISKEQAIKIKNYSSKGNRMNNKYCLVEDDDGHWYCIPVEERDNFNLWVYEEDDRFDFDIYRLDMHPSNYCFENFEEIHKK